jgi:hypothetical protein
VIAQPTLFHQMSEYTLRCWRAADVAHANE